MKIVTETDTNNLFDNNYDDKLALCEKGCNSQQGQADCLPT